MNVFAYCWTGMGKTEKASQNMDIFSYQSAVLPECRHPYQGYRHAFTVWAQGQEKPWIVTGQGGEVVLMSTYEVLSLLFFGGSFLVALLCIAFHNNAKTTLILWSVEGWLCYL